MVWDDTPPCDANSYDRHLLGFSQKSQSSRTSAHGILNSNSSAAVNYVTHTRYESLNKNTLASESGTRKRTSGGQRKTLRKSYLDLLRKLQLDSNDSALCGSKGNLKNILELICNEPVEFNLRLDHYGLNEDVREWLAGPNNVL